MEDDDDKSKISSAYHNICLRVDHSGCDLVGLNSGEEIYSINLRNLLMEVLRDGYDEDKTKLFAESILKSRLAKHAGITYMPGAINDPKAILKWVELLITSDNLVNTIFTLHWMKHKNWLAPA